ncbi:tetratricopeptide repeat-containing sensor histidine kinase [Hwangdonia lutea]|uniref:Tetratricopeptide repeat protein n=1 Tax=Hwangdonia lutea TaxID=3075823 RepID=A0AA97HSN0_9FLAO|nr:tetratricopeptide repeat protein [Hwangdonia sp. SCSIO 19198]WOD44643.1 tetratricopeptide repeat protein [Hwangdonia sp. SCSIO 19198]
MKIIFFYISLFTFITSAQAQETKTFKVIDSIQKNGLANSQDSLLFADAHYKIGEGYRYSILADSAYYHYHKAEQIYRKFNNKLKIAKTLYGIAVIQKDEKDFTGSEVTSVEAISLLNQLEKTNEVDKYKSFLFNNLGLVFDQLELYDESISYHKKALAIKRKLKGNTKATIDNSKNNLALSYKNSQQYKLALDFYGQILKNKNLVNERPDFYALVLDNYAHTLYLTQNEEQLPDLYLKALRICDSLNNSAASYNSIVINQHLAEYYHDKNVTDSALHYAYRAKDISEQYHNDDLLKSLLLLSKVEEGNTAAKYLKDYISLSDSLQKAERTIRNKFARIKYETNQIEQENIRIARERLWLLIISIILIVTSFLIYLVVTQRNKNKELKFIQQQQETNEEIYNLMLSQQDNIEEARTLEKKRVSQELHDGVLGRLFGTRLSLDSLNMGTSVEAINTRSQYINELKTIEEDIRKVSHELNTDFVSGSGFMDIIKTLIETQTKAYGFNYELNNKDVDWEEASNKTKIHIYRIIQESLQNIYKHANATLVKISFEVKNNVFCLTINDNGSGFDVNKAKKGIGLKNINSRVEEIKGELTIKSELNKGTTIKIKVKTD